MGEEATFNVFYPIFSSHSFDFLGVSTIPSVIASSEFPLGEFYSSAVAGRGLSSSRVSTTMDAAPHVRLSTRAWV